MKRDILLEVSQMSKNFGATQALNRVDLSVYAGEIRGLIGENGSGKSTVTSIIAGMQKASSGKMVFQGKPWNPSSMAVAQEQGISMILQEANTVGFCTVAENIFAGQLHKFTRLGVINVRKMNAAATALLEKFAISHIKATDIIDRYGFEDRKMIEIVRTVSDNTQILVVDETTTALSHEGRTLLYNLMRQMADNGKAVLFISHDIEEIIEQCTTLTVLRDGNIIGHLEKNDMLAMAAIKNIRTMMVGRDIGDAYYRKDYDPSHWPEVALEISNVDFGQIKDFSLTLHRGEIIGFGGLSGSGMHEIGRLAFGLEKPISGHVTRNGRSIVSPQVAIKNGIGYISKNRDSEALILAGSIADNIALPSIADISRLSFVSPKAENILVNREVKHLEIKCQNARQWVSALSGGNKQKVSFAKWTAKGCDVIVMDCPTRGVDVGVKQAMYAFIADMKKQGKAIIMISEELTELIGMSDRLIIMKDFQVSHEFARSSELKETDIIEYMI